MNEIVKRFVCWYYRCKTYDINITASSNNLYMNVFIMIAGAGCSRENSCSMIFWFNVRYSGAIFC